VKIPGGAGPPGLGAGIGFSGGLMASLSAGGDEESALLLGNWFFQPTSLPTNQTKNLDPVAVVVSVDDLFVEFRTDPSMRWPIQGLSSFCFLMISEMLNSVAWKGLAG